MDVTLTGLEERVTKMEERADVINEVELGKIGPGEKKSIVSGSTHVFPR